MYLGIQLYRVVVRFGRVLLIAEQLGNWVEGWLVL